MNEGFPPATEPARSEAGPAAGGDLRARPVLSIPALAAAPEEIPPPVRYGADAEWPAWVRYAIGVGAAVVAIALTALLRGAFEGIPFMPAFLAIFVAGALAGPGPSRVTAVVSGAVAHFAIYGSEIPATGHLRLLLFLAVAALISVLQAKLWETRIALADFRREVAEARGAAERAEDQARQILETVSDAFCTLDRDFRFTYVNARAARVLGRPREELIGKDVRREYPVDPHATQVLERAVHERVPGHFETLFRPTSRWIAATVYPRGDGASILFRDMTRRKQSEQDLKRLASIVESSEDAIVAKNLDGIITAWNAGAQRLFGYTAEEIIGQPISVIMPQERKGDMTAILDRIRKGERVEHFETVRIHKNGTPLIVSLSVSPIRDAQGTIIGASKIARNITERREAERRILEAQRQLQLALTAARMGTWSWKLDGMLTLSPQVAQMHGLPDGPAESSYDEFLALVHEEDRDRVNGILRAAIDDGAAFQTEYRVPDPAGRTRWVALLGQKSAGAVPAESRLVGIARDATEAKESEAERERLYREAQEAIQIRDAFLSVAGHEFRTPLGALTLTLHNLGRALEPSVPEKARKGLDAARRQAQRLARLTEYLLEVGRINAGRLDLEREPTDLADVVEEAVGRLDETARRAESPISVRAEAALVGEWDRSRLDQVVTNLLTNAINFGRGRPVEVEASRRDGNALLTIRDHGIGISPEHQARIFERFERAVSNRSYAGIGLGLWICRQIVEAHGGTIGVESEPGHGATFRVELPGLIQEGKP
jgi:PAS domain S-box-containing protein